MTRLRAVRAGVCAASFALTIPTALLAQPSIDHPGIECIEPGKYAVILSGIDPELEIHTAKLYFRSALYPDFYYVEMTYENGRFVGILPQPTPETKRIIYYLEAIDGIFNSARSIEWDPLVEDCDDDPAAAYFTEEATGIIVGATTLGSSALPPGFSAAGVIGTIAATGMASGVGGGVGAGAAVAVAAGAAGAAGTVVVTSGGDATTSSVPVSADPGPASTTSVPTSTTSTAPGNTTTVPGSSTTTVPGPSTTTVPGPSTTTVAGSPTTTIPTTSSTSTSTTSTSTTTTTAPPLNAGCFTLQVLSDCKVRLDATCVNLPVDQYDWILDVDDRWQRVVIKNGGATITYDWGDECDDQASLKFTLTVNRGGATNTATKSITVPGNDLKASPDRQAPRLRLQAHLDLPPANSSVRGRIQINDLGRVIAGSNPVVLEARAASGTQTVVATVLRGGGVPGHWRFGFDDPSQVEPATVRIVQGNVLSVDRNGIVFRLSGRDGERVELTFELRQP